MATLRLKSATIGTLDFVRADINPGYAVGMIFKDVSIHFGTRDWVFPGFLKNIDSKTAWVPTKYLVLTVIFANVPMEFGGFPGLKACSSNGTFEGRRARSKPIGRSWNPFELRRDPGFGWLQIRLKKYESPWAKGGQGLTKPRKKGNVVPTFAGCFEYSTGKTGIPWSELRNLG